DFLTIHVGLGRDTTIDLSWNRTIERLAAFVRFASGMGVRVCLENLAWGWTSRPQLFEKLIRKSACWATLDIGHAVVSPSVITQQYQVGDFVLPHGEKILNGHVYHEEKGNHHLPPKKLEDLQDRLRMLLELPRCDWWVLELKQEQPLLRTLEIVREFLWLECRGGHINLPRSAIKE
ncbi:MAG: TIM barrel protein, partial [Deltaproteobacteria bacterium]